MTGSEPVPRAILRQWQEAERRLYPLVLSSPERYEHSVRLARAVADELSAVARPQDLAAWCDRSEELLVRAAAQLGTGLDGVDHDAVAGAAFALRYGELETEAGRTAALERIETARREGLAWVTLHESGARTDLGVVPPYHLVETCLHRPGGVHAAALFDVEANTVVYLIEFVHVDLATAEWWSEETPQVEPRTYADFTAWQSALARLRAELAG